MFTLRAIVPALLLSGLLAGCASTKTVPITVQSDPLGAQVMMMIKGQGDLKSDWIYLGNTPMTAQRKFDKTNFDDKHTIVLRLQKDGYLEQTKEWRGDNFKKTVKKQGQVFWNPKLVGN